MLHQGTKELKSIVVVLLLAIWHPTSLADSVCEREKKEADHWNQVLKNRVTENARTKHREAKKIFLDCLREDLSAYKAPVKSLKIPKTTKPLDIYNRSIPSTRNVNVSDYTGFKGKKKQAWERYYIESPECLKNRNDMQMFVRCASLRKDYLKEFKSRWDDKSQTLRPLFIQN